MSNPWFRLYSRIITDPIIEFLSFDDQRHFVWILCLKNDGVLDHNYPDPDMLDVVVARKLGLQNEAFKNVKTRLIHSGLINDRWQPKKWNDLQFKSDSSTERVRQYREKQGKSTDKTLQKRYRNVTVTAQDTDTDTEQTIEPPLTPPQKKQKKTWAAPDWINQPAWSEFEQHRTTIKKPLSDLARTKAANQLQNLTHEQQQSCIDNSIQSRWPGLYPDKINGSNQQNNQSRPKTRNEIHRDIYRQYAEEGIAKELDSGDIRDDAAEIRESVDSSIRRLPWEH